MDWCSLTNPQWEKLKIFRLTKPTDLSRTGGDGPLLVEAVLWIVRTGSSWRDLPPSFGEWNTIYKRFSYRVKAGVFQRVFDTVSGKPDTAYAMMDATIVKVHRHDQGAKGGLKIRQRAGQGRQPRPQPGWHHAARHSGRDGGPKCHGHPHQRSRADRDRTNPHLERLTHG